MGVACDLGYPCAKFRLPRPFGFRVRADVPVRDIRQTDGQTTDADDRLMPPPPLRGRGHNNLHALTAITAPLYTADSDISVCYLPFNARRKNELNRTVTQMTDRLVAALASDLQHYPV